MHLGSPHTEPLNWNLGWERQKPFSALQHIIPSVTALGQRMVVPPTFAGMDSLSQLPLPNNLLSRYLPQPVQSPPFLGGGLDMLPVNQVNNADPSTMYPVNQLPDMTRPVSLGGGVSPGPVGPMFEGNNPAVDSGFPTRYIYPDKTTGSIPRNTGITGPPTPIRPRRSDREPILEGNNPVVNTGIPTGRIGPLPPRAAPFQGSLMEGNNPPVPAPGPEGVGGFAHFMRTRGTPLSNDQLVNAQIALGLGLGLR